LNDTPVILFPHTQITVLDLEKILAGFGQVTICQPWFMESPLPANERGDLASVNILHPAKSLKPKEDFKRLILEYQLWLRQNQDKGSRTFLAATQEGAPSEATPWEIRQLISKREDDSDPLADQTFKWHVILHLAREFEENRLEAEIMLNKLKSQKSPLEDALEEAPPQMFFDNSSLMETQLQVGNYHLRQVIEAWFGLFGESLSDEGSLITLDPHVIRYAVEVLEPEEKIIKLKSSDRKGFSSDSVSGQLSNKVKHLPRLSNGEDTANDPVKKGLSGRTIILIED